MLTVRLANTIFGFLAILAGLLAMLTIRYGPAWRQHREGIKVDSTSVA